MASSSSTHDILAADILYHKLCYNKLKYILLQQKHKRQQQKEEKGNIHKKGEVIRRFFKLIEQKVLNDNKVFLLIDLLGDISNLNKEKGLEPVATSKKNLCKE